MITNAEQHVLANRVGEWRTAHRLFRCDRYFGEIASCRRAITSGSRYFDTKETVPDAGRTASFKVCANCGNSVCSADFLASAKEKPGMFRSWKPVVALALGSMAICAALGGAVLRAPDSLAADHAPRTASAP